LLRYISCNLDGTMYMIRYIEIVMISVCKSTFIPAVCMCVCTRVRVRAWAHMQGSCFVSISKLGNKIKLCIIETVGAKYRDLIVQIVRIFSVF
jgi:hypothetical protein